MRSISFLIFLFLSLGVFAQEILFEEPVKLSSGQKITREVYPLVDKNSGEITIFMLDKDSILCHSMNSDFTLMKKLETRRQPKKYPDLLGSCHNSGVIHLFFCNGPKTSLLVKSFNFTENKVKETELTLKLSGERLLESFSDKDKFHILTIDRGSMLRIYSFGTDLNYTLRTYDASHEQFGDGTYNTLFDVLHEGDQSWTSIKVYRVDTDGPNSIDVTSKGNKIYFQDNKLYLTTEEMKTHTSILVLGLTDSIYQSIKVPRPGLECNSKIKGNSFLSDDLLWQFTCSKEEMTVRVTKIPGYQIIANYRANRQEEINFSNSPLYQEGSISSIGQKKTKVLETTESFLRKTLNGNVGITAYNIRDRVLVTLGSYKEVQQMSSGGAMPGMMLPGHGISTAPSLDLLTISNPSTFNPTFISYQTYIKIRSTYVKAIFEPGSIAHLDGEASELAFDKIREYTRMNIKQQTIETVFRYRDFYILGTYNLKEKKFCLVKFEE